MLLDVGKVAVKTELALVVVPAVLPVICEVVVIRVVVCAVLVAGRAALERVTPTKAEPIMIASITTVSLGAMVKRNSPSPLLKWRSAKSNRRY